MKKLYFLTFIIFALLFAGNSFAVTPSAPILVSPQSTATFDYNPTLFWNTPVGGGANSYIVSVEGYSDIIIKNNPGATSLDLKTALPPLASKSYDWYVRACGSTDGAKECSPKSETRYFTIDRIALTLECSILTQASKGYKTGEVINFILGGACNQNCDINTDTMAIEGAGGKTDCQKFDMSANCSFSATYSAPKEYTIKGRISSTLPESKTATCEEKITIAGDGGGASGGTLTAPTNLSPCNTGSGIFQSPNPTLSWQGQADYYQVHLDSFPLIIVNSGNSLTLSRDYLRSLSLSDALSSGSHNWYVEGCSGSACKKGPTDGTCSFAVNTGGSTGSTGGSGSTGGGITIDNPLNANNIQDLLNSIINFIFTIGLALAPIMLIIAGFLYVTSAGDAKRLDTAKQMMLYTVIGLAVLLLARGLVAVLRSIIGG